MNEGEVLPVNQPGAANNVNAAADNLLDGPVNGDRTQHCIAAWKVG
jgi:hypothetical protein